jgi:hypothetical protein
MRTITITLTEDGGGLHAEYSVDPPISFGDRAKTNIERVAREMLDAAAEYGIIAQSKE